MGQHRDRPRICASPLSDRIAQAQRLPPASRPLALGLRALPLYQMAEHRPLERYLADSIRNLLTTRWPDVAASPKHWCHLDQAGLVLWQNQMVELIELMPSGSPPVIIHACKFGTRAEIDFLRRASSFYKSITGSVQVVAILLTLAIDQEEAEGALALGLEVKLDLKFNLLRTNGPVVSHSTGKLWEYPLTEEAAPRPMTPTPASPSFGDVRPSARALSDAARRDGIIRPLSSPPGERARHDSAPSVFRPASTEPRRDSLSLHRVPSGLVESPPPSSPLSRGSSASDMDNKREKEDSSDEEGDAGKSHIAGADKRRHVLLEIVQTERDYVSDLELLMEAFYRPINLLQLIPQSDMDAIFADIPELIAINKPFLAMLETSKQSSENNLNAMCLGVFFRRMVEPFKRYSRFFSGYAVAYAVVERCTDQLPDFASFLQENKMNPRVRGLDLNQFLIKPVQRICKYPLLLRELLKATPPDHADLPELTEAAKEFDALVAELNEKKRTSETHQKVLELMSSVDGLDKQAHFAKANRAFVMEGELKVLSGKKSVKHRVVLFSDLLLYVAIREKATKDGKKFDFVGMLPLNQHSRIVDIADSDDHKNVFHLQHPDGTVSLICATFHEKRRWIREMRTYINESLKKDIKSKLAGSTGGPDSRSGTPVRSGSLSRSTGDVAAKLQQPGSMRLSGSGEETPKTPPPGARPDKSPVRGESLLGRRGSHFGLPSSSSSPVVSSPVKSGLK